MTLRAHTNPSESICSATAMEYSQIADDCRSMLRAAFRAMVRKPSLKSGLALVEVLFCYFSYPVGRLHSLFGILLCKMHSISRHSVTSLSEAWSGLYVLMEAVRHLRNGAARTSRAAPTSPRQRIVSLVVPEIA